MRTKKSESKNCGSRKCQAKSSETNSVNKKSSRAKDCN